MINRIVIDPNLYYKQTTPILYAVETRTSPDAFKIFGGQFPFNFLIFIIRLINHLPPLRLGVLSLRLHVSFIRYLTTLKLREIQQNI